MKRISFFIILLVLFFIILQLSTSIYTLWHKQDVLSSAQQELQQEKQEHARLQKELRTVQSPQFFDEEARNKLLLVKPGESDVLIDQGLLQASGSAQKKEAAKPYWQQWLDLFFSH